MITPFYIGFICGRDQEGDNFLFSWVNRKASYYQEMVDGWFEGLDQYHYIDIFQ